MTNNLASILYLVAAVLFILALKGLSSPKSARTGNILGIVGMVLAIGTTFYYPMVEGHIAIILALIIGGAIGAVLALRIEMTSMPQLVAAFHSLVGLAAVLVSMSALFSPESYNIGVAGQIKVGSLVEMSLGAAVGAITFSGSIIAFAKLQGIMSGQPIRFAGQQFVNLVIGLMIVYLTISFCNTESYFSFICLILLSFAIGVLLIIPIGGADMPVVVSMLNSYSGWAAAGIGFTLQNSLLIITGALVGASGAILSYIMCKAMNRSIFNVIFGGFGQTDSSVTSIGEDNKDKNVRTGSAEDAAYMLQNAESVIIVPGYGMAVAQAQHALREMTDHLKKHNIKTRFAIHPVAGRMPGHMNVLLAEANIDYEDVLELEEINRDFASTDVVLVIGANDITNPAAKNNPASPIYGMPILDIEKAKTVLFIKRGMAAGYAGIDNEIFYKNNTMMLFGDAKKVVESIIKAFEE